VANDNEKPLTVGRFARDFLCSPFDYRIRLGKYTLQITQESFLARTLAPVPLVALFLGVVLMIAEQSKSSTGSHLLYETGCVAGIRLDTPTPEWVRLWPVGFRELPESDKFHKWQVIELDAVKSRRDSRPESFTPHLHTLKLGDVIESKNKWRNRRELLGGLLGETTLCDLMAAQGGGG